ncbi:MAG: DUF3810 domain-containing protein [Clostridia bacterium]|nr:DUF3810 domain-containing protein [Clostridia bacterium]
MTEKKKFSLRKYVSPFAVAFTVFFLLGLAATLISRKSASFADFWQAHIASVPRAALALLTDFFPFSLAETLILSIPLIFAVVMYNSDKIAGTRRSLIRFIINAASVCLLIFGLLFFNFSAGYNTSTLDKRLGLKRDKVSAEELYDTADTLLLQIRSDAEKIDFIYGGFSVMPYGISDLNAKLNESYKKVCAKHGFISDFITNVKQVALSEPWTYTHIAGVYTFFTGEANINMNFPDYTLPFTAAHEMAHQRGIAREDEANFVAFLVCAESDDPYIRYSGYVSVFEYVASALNKADPKMYSSLYHSSVPENLKNEMRAYNEFFEKYKENKVAEVSGKINNGYLHSQGVKEGSRSYNLVVDLAVAYVKSGKH